MMKTVEVSGLRWQEPGAVDVLGVNAVTAKVLCRDHNAALSKLDDEAGRFFAMVRHLAEPGWAMPAPVRDSHPHLHQGFGLVSGHVVERWALKALCGIIAGRMAKMDHDMGGWSPPVPWLSLLIDAAPWPSGWGFWGVPRSAIPEEVTSGTVSVSPVFQGDAITGVFLVVAGSPFFLALADKDQLDDLITPEWKYRPGVIRIPKDGTAIIALTWRPGDGR